MSYGWSRRARLRLGLFARAEGEGDDVSQRLHVAARAGQGLIGAREKKSKTALTSPRCTTGKLKRERVPARAAARPRSQGYCGWSRASTLSMNTGPTPAQRSTAGSHSVRVVARVDEARGQCLELLAQRSGLGGGTPSLPTAAGAQEEA